MDAECSQATPANVVPIVPTMEYHSVCKWEKKLNLKYRDYCPLKKRKETAIIPKEKKAEIAGFMNYGWQMQG